MNAVFHILGLSKMIEDMNHSERLEWLQKIKENGNILFQETQFQDLILSGSSKSRKIAVQPQTQQPRYVLCPTCGDPTAEIRKDTKGRIYLSHQLCGNRWFTHTPHSAIHFTGFTNLFAHYHFQSQLEEWKQTGKSIWFGWTRGINIQSKQGGQNVHSTENISEKAN